MATKKCDKCGWEVDIQDTSRRCPVCKTPYEYGICSICKQYIKYYRHNRTVCKHCYDTVTRKPDAYANMWKRRREVYAEWCEKIKKVPKTYPTLTNEQWLEAVRHFNGCALCKSSSIDTRAYFIPFKDGGRYCDWNIIPICEECATENRRNPNHFMWTRPVGLIDVINYLEVRLNGAIKS